MWTGKLVKTAEQYAARVKKADRKLALAWVAYCEGRRTERPANVPRRIVYWCAYLGAVDPLGFDIGEDGRDLSRKLGGRKVYGQEPEELKRIRMANMAHRCGRADGFDVVPF